MSEQALTPEERAADFRKKYLCGVMGQKELERHFREAELAATERAAGISMDLCELVDIGAKQPCGRCTPCHIAQKIRGE